MQELLHAKLGVYGFLPSSDGTFQPGFESVSRIMVYVFGIAGFVLGFLGGLFVINLFLKNFSRRELLTDKSLRWTYGLAVWVFAGLGSWGGVWLYERSFL